MERSSIGNGFPFRSGCAQVMGFSAGGRAIIGVALEHGAESCPNFAAAISSVLWGDTKVPDDAPPLFIAFASDDELAVDADVSL